jgi:hypothetical protein
VKAARSRIATAAQPEFTLGQDSGDLTPVNGHVSRQNAIRHPIDGLVLQTADGRLDT